MRILMMAWRDIKNPEHGGAEIATHENMKRWIKVGHECTLLSAEYSGCLNEEIIDGYKVVRKGGRLGVYYQAYKYYKKNKDNFDLVIDQVNTIPFFTPLYVKDKKLFSLFHQLCREIWFYERVFPIALIGYVSEYFYLKLYKNIPAIVVSNSTKKDLTKRGFKNISIVSEGINFNPLNKPKKKEKNSLIYVGRLKKSKRVHHIIKSLNIVKEKIPNVKLYIVGDGEEKYKKYLIKLMKKYNLESNIKFTGYLDFDKRNELMSKSEAILVASVKEGWGLIVTEANAMSTPAIVYNVDGLRDAVKNNSTGLIIEPSPNHLSESIIGYLRNNGLKTKLSKNALEDSRGYNWDKSAEESLKVIENA